MLANMSSTTNAQHTDAEAAVRAVVAELQQAQQAEDVEAFVGLFRSDAVWTTAHGKRLTGLPEIAEFTGKVLPGAMREATARYEVTHVVWVRPDVAVVNVAQRAVDLAGNPLDEVPQGRPTYIVARGEEGWQLVAGQNTQVVP
jgi:uncharacterized protein (TIGR02246 family)